MEPRISTLNALIWARKSVWLYSMDKNKGKRTNYMSVPRVYTEALCNRKSLKSVTI